MSPQALPPPIEELWVEALLPLVTLQASPEFAGAGGFADQPTLFLRRAWPRGSDRLHLEYMTSDDGARPIAAQRFATPHGLVDASRLRRVAEATAASGPVAVLSTLGVLLQAAGADRRLAGLAPLVARRGAMLVAHRPERRAVVRLARAGREGRAEQAGRAGGPVYAKVVRPGRSDALVMRNKVAAGQAALRAPAIVAHDTGAGVVVTEALQGPSLSDLLGGRRTHDAIEAARVTGAALRALHDKGPRWAERAVPGLDLAVRDAAAEREWLGVWIDRLVAYAPGARRTMTRAATVVDRRLSGTPTRLVAVHADLHDQQVVLTSAGDVGVLDWDTLALGEGALDLANLHVHVQMRALQGRCSSARAEQVGAALLDGYRPSAAQRRRVRAYAALLRLRLCCQYAFRPRESRVIGSLLATLDDPPPGWSP